MPTAAALFQTQQTNTVRTWFTRERGGIYTHSRARTDSFRHAMHSAANKEVHDRPTGGGPVDYLSASTKIRETIAYAGDRDTA